MTAAAALRIDLERLLERLEALGRVGAIEGGGVCRLAFTEADRLGRDLVSGWMRALGLEVTVDRIGNVVGLRAGREGGPPVMAGSHIDTVRSGGRYDGALGVLGALEVIETLNEAGIETRQPLAVAFFSNEEGARFAPDMMGSAVHQGALELDTALATRGIDGATVGEELGRIGYRGAAPCPAPAPRCYLELHIEQGPVLAEEGTTIGAVEGVQGISWTELTVRGTANHAGTTPMRLRHDAGYVAAAIAVEARRIATELGGHQVATVGRCELHPDLVNVIAERALLTVDLRNTEETLLGEAERRLAAAVAEIAEREGVAVSSRPLARFAPVPFDPALVARVEAAARERGHSVRRLPSGAGHDAQMFAPRCPTAMIFVPSQGGISHNVAEHSEPEHIRAGAEVLLEVLLEAAGA